MAGPHEHLTMMFHPTSTVDDLEVARAWYRRVFGREGITWAQRWDFSRMKSDYPKDYSFLIHLGDVVFDVLSPSLILEKTGRSPAYPAGEGMADLAWYAEDVPGLAEKVIAHGYRIVGQGGEPIPPGPDLARRLESSLTNDSDLFWVAWEDAGIAYEFFKMGESHREFYSRIGDPRLRPDWTLPPVSADDPLGVIRCSHHTVITRDASKGVRLYTRPIDGTIIDQHFDPRRNADSTFVSIANSVIEFAQVRDGHVIDPRTGAEADRDIYTGITLQVQDVERAAAHLVAEGLTVARDGDEIYTDPAETFGVEWVFSPRSRTVY